MSNRLVSVDDLATVDDIAARLKLNVNCMMNIVRGRDGRYTARFPEPILGKDTRAVWLWDDVESWYAEALPTISQARKRARTRRVNRASRRTYH